MTEDVVDGELVDDSPGLPVPARTSPAAAVNAGAAALQQRHRAAAGGMRPGAPVELPEEAALSGRRVARSVAARGDRHAVRDLGPNVLDMPMLPAYVDQVDDDVPAEVDEELQEAVSKDTMATIKYQWSRFVRWCVRHDRDFLPPSIGTIRTYIWAHYTMTKPDGTLCGRRGRPYAPATVETALGCICSVLVWNGYTSPWHHPRVRKQLEAYERKWTQAGNTPDQSHAITLEESARMIRTQDMTTCVGVRNAAMLAMQRATGMRAAELVALNIADLRWEMPDGDGPERLLVTIRSGKGGKKRVVPVKANTGLDPDDPDYDPDDPGVDPDVDALLLLREHLELMASRGITRGPLWPQVASGKRRLVGHSGKYLDKAIDRPGYEKVHNTAVKDARVDVDPVTGAKRIVTSHGERAGYITGASEAGTPVEHIRPITGHAENSPVIFRYVRLGIQWGDNDPLTRTRRAAIKNVRKAQRKERVREGGGSA
jgi:hypothetical protein